MVVQTATRRRQSSSPFSARLQGVSPNFAGGPRLSTFGMPHHPHGLARVHFLDSLRRAEALCRFEVGQYPGCLRRPISH